MQSVLEVSKEGITIHNIPLTDRIVVGSEEWKKIPDRSISNLDRNIQFRLIDGKNLMVYLLDKNSKITLKGTEHLGPKTLLIPHNEKIIIETGHSLKLSTDMVEENKVFSKATIFKSDLPGLKIDGMPVVFDAADDAVDIVESNPEKDDDLFNEDIDEIELEKALDDKVELNKLYYDDDDEDFKNELVPKDSPKTPPPVDEIKSDQQREQEAVQEIIDSSNQEVESIELGEIEIDEMSFDVEESQSSEESEELVELQEEPEEKWEEEKWEEQKWEEQNNLEAHPSDGEDQADLESDDWGDLKSVEEFEPESTQAEQEDDDVFDISLDEQDDEEQPASEKTDPVLNFSQSQNNIEIGEDFEEQVKEDLQHLEEKIEQEKTDPNILEHDQTEEVVEVEAEAEAEAEEGTQEPVEEILQAQKDDVEIPDDEEWEKIQAQMQKRLNPDEVSQSDTDKTDPSRAHFDILESNESDEDEEDDTAEPLEENTKALKDFGTRIKNLFSRKKKSEPEFELEVQEEESEISNDELEMADGVVGIGEDLQDAASSDNKTFVQKLKNIFTRKHKIKKGELEMDESDDTNPSRPHIVFEDETKTSQGQQTETFLDNEMELEKAPKDDHGLFPEDETINYEELDFERPEVSEIRKLEDDNDEQSSKSFSQTVMAQLKNIFRKNNLNDDTYSDFTDLEETNEFKEFKAKENAGSSQGPNKLTNFLNKIKALFKRDKEAQQEIDLAEKTNVQIEAEEIAKSLDKNFKQGELATEEEEYEEDEEEEYEDEEYEEEEEEKQNKGGLFSSKKKKKKKPTNKALLKAAKKGKKKHGQDPRPGVFARVLSFTISAFIVFNVTHFFGDHPKVEKVFEKHIDKHILKTQSPLKQAVRKMNQLIPAKTPAQVKKYVSKYYNPNNINILFTQKNYRYLVTYLAFEIIFLLLLGNSLPLYLFGSRNEISGIKARLQALLRLLLWPVTLALPVLDLPLLIKRRSFREMITGSHIYYPSLSYRNFAMFVATPLAFVGFFIWPYFLNLNIFSSREVKLSTYRPVPESELQYSEILDISLKPELGTGYVFIPAWEIGRDQKMQASLKIYSIKTDQQAYMKKYRDIDLAKILQQVTKFDPLFYHFHPKLKPFQKDSQETIRKENLLALNEYLLSCLSLSIFDYQGIFDLYKTGPYINDDLVFKKLFLKHLDQVGIKQIIVHQNGEDKTIEVVPSRQSSVQTSYFLALSDEKNYLYSLTYTKKAIDTRKQITNLSLNQMSFTYKSPTPVSDQAIKTLENFKKIVNPKYTEEKAFNDLFIFYYDLAKDAINSNQKKYIDLAKEEVIKTGDLIGKLKQDPKISQKYREKFRTLAKALETLDVRYFSL